MHRQSQLDMEVLTEIRRCRPHWCIASPDLSEFRRLRYDWKRKAGGYWDRVYRDQNPPITDESLRSEGELKLAREEYKTNRTSVAKLHPKGEHNQLQAIFHEFVQMLPGWDGNPVEYWRVPSLNMFSTELMIYASPVREWLDSQVDVFQMLADSESVNHLWLHEMQAANVPRQWLREAFEFIQMWRSVTPGNPVDSQLATYLTEVDVVISADKNFVHMATRCHNEAPFRTAQAILIGGHNAGVSQLLEMIRNGMPLK